MEVPSTELRARDKIKRLCQVHYSYNQPSPRGLKRIIGVVLNMACCRGV